MADGMKSNMEKICEKIDPVLAMYDVKGKQQFIFNGHRIKEIAGGSFIIRDCFDDYLYPAAMEISDKGIFNDTRVDFSEESLMTHFAQGYIGEVVYDGGGNYFVIFKNEDIFKEITFIFTKSVIDKVGTLQILGTCIHDLNYNDYIGDRDRLYAKHRYTEATECFTPCWGSVPVVQVDRRTSMPLVGKVYKGTSNREKVSKEGMAKYIKYDEVICKSQANNINIGTKILDDLVTEKGVDSLLAIVYIDGNSMGAKVQNLLSDKHTYTECIKALRDFSNKIEQDYITDRIKDIDKYFELSANGNISDNSKSQRGRRLVVSAGDEVNIICNAHDAFDMAKIYLGGLPENASSCAGIAIFHSHAPYSEAYRIAEECCETGKDLMKTDEWKRTGIKEASFIDFHYCQGAIGVSLEKIREVESDIEISRPWLINYDGVTSLNKANSDLSAYTTLDDIRMIESYLTRIGRSNVKGLATAAKNGIISLETELDRIEAHMTENVHSELKPVLDKLKSLDKDKKKRLIYDMVIVYDLWFKEK